MRNPGRKLAAAAVMVLAGATAACGGGGTDAATLLARAPDKTLAAKTAQFSVDASATSGDRTISERGDGVVAFATHMVDVVFGRPADAGQPDRQLRTIIIGNDIWSTTPPSLKGTAGAKAYVHTTTAAVSANPLAQLSQPDDPTRVLGELKGIEGKGVKKVGSEKVRGFDTTHYEGTVDLASVAAKDPGAEPQAAALQKLLNTNIVPVDVWLDKEGRVRRVRLTLQHIKITSAAAAATTTTVAGQAATPPPSSGGLQVDLVLTNEFAAFGTVVNVTAPPADQVMEVPAPKG